MLRIWNGWIDGHWVSIMFCDLGGIMSVTLCYVMDETSVEIVKLQTEVVMKCIKYGIFVSRCQFMDKTWYQVLCFEYVVSDYKAISQFYNKMVNEWIYSASIPKQNGRESYHSGVVVELSVEGSTLVIATILPYSSYHIVRFLGTEYCKKNLSLSGCLK